MSKYWSDKTDNVDIVVAEDFNTAFSDIAEDINKANTKLDTKVDKVSGKGLIDSTFAQNIDEKKIWLGSGQGDEGVLVKPNLVSLSESAGESAQIKGNIISMSGSVGTSTIEQNQISVANDMTGSSTKITPGEVQLLTTTYTDDGEEVLTMHKLTDKANIGEIKGIVQNNDLAFDDGKKIILKLTDGGETGTNKLEASNITLEYNNMRTRVSPASVDVAFTTESQSVYVSPTDVEIKEGTNVVHALSDKADKSDVFLKSDDVVLAKDKIIKVIKSGESTAWDGSTENIQIRGDAIFIRGNDVEPYGLMLEKDGITLEAVGESGTVKTATISTSDVTVNEHKLTLKANAADVGKLSDLETTDKSSIVAAINEVKSSGGGDVLDNLTYDSTNDIINSSANLLLENSASVAAYNGTFRGEIKVGQLGENKWAYTISPTTGFSTSLEVTCTSGNKVHSLANKADASDVITKTNTTAFTPTADYQPATKKYVDDTIKAAIEEYDTEAMALLGED